MSTPEVALVGPTTSRTNKERFDSIAATFDDNPGRVALARGVVDAILNRTPLTGRESAMELGCGTGLVTAVLASYLGHVLAVDGSPQMLEMLGSKIHHLRIPNVDTIEADIASQIPRGPFELVFSSMTLHHIADVEQLFKQVYQCVIPGGRVAFADLAREDGTFHADNVSGVEHHGFDEATILNWIKAAGFVDAEVHQAYLVKKQGADGATREYPVFLMTAQRPA